MNDFDAYSASQIELAIHSAMRAHDMPAVVSLLHVLAVKDPHRARLLLDIIELASEVAS